MRQKIRTGLFALVWALTVILCTFGGICASPAAAGEAPNHPVTIDTLKITTSKKGFHPSAGNYVRITYSVDVSSMNWPETNVTLKILNPSGKWVYRTSGRVAANVFSNGAYGQLKWNGKAGKGNEAGVKAKSYVKAGTYTVEVTAIAKDSETQMTYSAIRLAKLKVSKSAPKGAAGLKSIAAVPVLSGYDNVDYLADLMVKKAGVKKKMSQDQKVKKIYHWMTKNFHHSHYFALQKKYKSYYNVKKLEGKIRSYRAKNDALLKKGKVIYNYDGAGEWNMVHRIGVCDDHAAIFALLCRHVGVEAGTAGGFYKNLNGTRAPHAWAWAVIGGRTYYYDIDVQIQNLSKGVNPYYWYKKTKSQAKSNHIFKFDSSGHQTYLYGISPQTSFND